MLRTTFSVLLVVVLVVASAAAQKPVIKQAAAPQTSASNGNEMYMSYCASCHGKDAKGHGPAAPALKTAVPDVTTMAKRNGGKFPNIHVQQVIKGDTALIAHGSKEMPVWGPVFRSLSQGDQSLVQLRITNLANYIESLQTK